MSHFCLSRDSDEMVSEVSVGSAEATAFVWGGASGSEYGQILELWSQQSDIRISANEASASANWIVSYTERVDAAIKRNPSVRIAQMFMDGPDHVHVHVWSARAR
jgi:hypothetical protein